MGVVYGAYDPELDRKVALKLPAHPQRAGSDGPGNRGREAGRVRQLHRHRTQDLADPAPAVSCAPASGSSFALGTTTVSCSATDGSGNHAEASFPIAIEVSWSNLLAPIDLLGTAAFLRRWPSSSR